MVVATFEKQHWPQKAQWLSCDLQIIALEFFSHFSCFCDRNHATENRIKDLGYQPIMPNILMVMGLREYQRR